MGWGATLAATSFAMLFALGLAESGHFNGDAFIASSVVAIALSVAIFTFFPVGTILASAFEDGNGAFSATAFFNRLFTAKIWNVGCLSGGGALRRRLEHAAARAALRRRLHRRWAWRSR